MNKTWLHAPLREYIFIGLLLFFLGIDFFVDESSVLLFVIAFITSTPTLVLGMKVFRDRKINIDTFNSFALIITFITWEITSAAFISLMLSFARLLDWYTETRTKNAVEELLKLKPRTARKEINGVVKKVNVEQVTKGDVLIVRTGDRIPVDGRIVYGESHLNESSVTGESALVTKKVGDEVFSSTLNESGAIKVQATHVGKDSILERMATLIEEASKNKSKTQKLADKFAQIFLPIVGITGLATYLVTKDISMTVALFLVACADDIAVSIPLAMTASLGRAAKQGVIIKGGQWLDVLTKTKIVVFDKTGTLTRGKLVVTGSEIIDNKYQGIFWILVGAAEKYSEHPIGKAILREAEERAGISEEPNDFKVYKGNGVWAKIRDHEIAIGDEGIVKDTGLSLSSTIKRRMKEIQKEFNEATLLVFIDGNFSGFIRVGDIIKREAKEALSELRAIGITRLVMLTGDNKIVAQHIADIVGITEYRASITPEGKFKELGRLQHEGVTTMIGDGINDAPALARANVGVAMGTGGTAVAVETADVVILTDNLKRLPEIIKLGRRTTSVIYGDIATWIITNAVGFTLVFTGVMGPILAAIYNFATDFLPIINSARLFGRNNKDKKID